MGATEELRSVLTMLYAYCMLAHIKCYIFYGSAERGRNVKQKQTLGNQVIRKGWISIPVSLLKGSHRDYWFVLSGK